MDGILADSWMLGYHIMHHATQHNHSIPVLVIEESYHQRMK